MAGTFAALSLASSSGRRTRISAPNFFAAERISSESLLTAMAGEQSRLPGLLDRVRDQRLAQNLAHVLARDAFGAPARANRAQHCHGEIQRPWLAARSIAAINCMARLACASCTDAPCRRPESHGAARGKCGRFDVEFLLPAIALECPAHEIGTVGMAHGVDNELTPSGAVQVVDLAETAGQPSSSRTSDQLSSLRISRGRYVRRRRRPDAKSRRARADSPTHG